MTVETSEVTEEQVLSKSIFLIHSFTIIIGHQNTSSINRWYFHSPSMLDVHGLICVSNIWPTGQNAPARVFNPATLPVWRHYHFLFFSCFGARISHLDVKKWHVDTITVKGTNLSKTLRLDVQMCVWVTNESLVFIHYFPLNYVYIIFQSWDYISNFILSCGINIPGQISLVLMYSVMNTDSDDLSS